MDGTKQFLVAHILINKWLKFNLRNTFGVLLIGSGEVWLDGVQFIEVDRSVPTTHLLTELAKLPITPSNLDFNDN